jgi:uncharacterized SAM-binding protein YcdF (DUF218 family)
MAVLVSLIKHYLVPGSPWFLIVGIGMALLLLAGERTRALGRRWLAILFVLYVALSMPLVSSWLLKSLAGTGPLVADAGQARDTSPIVLLGNGVVSVGPAATAIHLPAVNTALNVSEAARLYRLLGRRRIIASGGMPPGGAGKRPESEVMRDYLAQLGVAGEDVALESTSINTTEQAAHVAALLPKGARVLLVTSPAHMPRSVALFRRHGLDVVPAVSDSLPDSTRTWMQALVPNRFALRASETAAYEFGAYVLYWLKGDIAK